MNHFYIIFFFVPLFLGTTFVIKENGLEVGRWTEDDGRDVVEVIDNTPPDPDKQPKSLEAPEPLDTDVGYQFSKPERPEGEIAMWRVGGRVVDLLTLKAIGGGTVLFSFGEEIVGVSVKADGFFRDELPEFKTGGYLVAVKGFQDYDTRVHLRKSGSFAKESYESRLRMRGTVPFSSMADLTVSGNTFEMKIGLMPLRLTKKQQEDYNRLVLNIAPLGEGIQSVSV